MKGKLWARSTFDEALRLSEVGLSDYAVARQTGVPRSTVHSWRSGSSRNAERPDTPEHRCPDCGATHSIAELDANHYAYLLGQYLGDGCIWRSATTGTCHLRIASDAQYLGIIEECCRAIAAIRGRRPYVRFHSEKRMASITSYWRAWPCLFPQHAPGRKHHR